MHFLKRLEWKHWEWEWFVCGECEIVETVYMSEWGAFMKVYKLYMFECGASG